MSTPNKGCPHCGYEIYDIKNVPASIRMHGTKRCYAHSTAEIPPDAECICLECGDTFTLNQLTVPTNEMVSA